MPYRIIYHPDVAAADLRVIPANIKSRIRKAIETRILIDPILVGTPLRYSLKGHRKVRVGDWRIIYRLEGKTIIVLKIGNRKDVYYTVLKRIS